MQNIYTLYEKSSKLMYNLRFLQKKNIWKNIRYICKNKKIAQKLRNYYLKLFFKKVVF